MYVVIKKSHDCGNNNNEHTCINCVHYITYGWQGLDDKIRAYCSGQWMLVTCLCCVHGRQTQTIQSLHMTGNDFMIKHHFLILFFSLSFFHNLQGFPKMYMQQWSSYLTLKNITLTSEWCTMFFFFLFIFFDPQLEVWESPYWWGVCACNCSATIEVVTFQHRVGVVVEESDGKKKTQENGAVKAVETRNNGGPESKGGSGWERERWSSTAEMSRQKMKPISIGLGPPSANCSKQRFLVTLGTLWHQRVVLAVCVCVYVPLCVCVWERERERAENQVDNYFQDHKPLLSAAHSLDS